MLGLSLHKEVEPWPIPVPIDPPLNTSLQFKQLNQSLNIPSLSFDAVSSQPLHPHPLSTITMTSKKSYPLITSDILSTLEKLSEAPSLYKVDSKTVLKTGRAT
jgi:hypothetical protein